MNYRTAFIRGVITSIGHIMLLLALFVFGVWLDIRGYESASVPLLIMGGSATLLAIHLLISTYRERINWFTSHQTIVDLARVNYKLDIIIEKLKKYGHADD